MTIILLIDRFALSNPTREVVHVRIDHDCADLRVVHNVDEWAYHKAAAGLPGKVERNMFRKTSDGRFELIVKPGEEVAVPFLFVSCRTHGDTKSSQVTSSNSVCDLTPIFVTFDLTCLVLS